MVMRKLPCTLTLQYNIIDIYHFEYQKLNSVKTLYLYFKLPSTFSQ